MDSGSRAQFEGTWLGGKEVVKVNVSIIIFEEDNTTIVFCPALDLAGYGNNETEALESFKIISGEYLKYATHKKTLSEDLLSHGWKLPKHKRQHFEQPLMSDLLSNNNEFNRVFNNLPYRKINEEFSIPVY